MREEVRFFGARALTTGAAVTTLMDEFARARGKHRSPLERWTHAPRRCADAGSTKPDDRRRMAAARSSSTRNLSPMFLRERIGGSAEKRDLLKGLSEPCRPLQPASSPPAQLPPNHT